MPVGLGTRAAHQHDGGCKLALQGRLHLKKDLLLFVLMHELCL